MGKIRIVFAGGHAATTALSVAEEVSRRALPWEIHFIGAKRAFEGKKISTLESQVFSADDVFFHGLISGRIQRKFTIWTIPSFIKIPLSFLHALILLLKIKPKIVLSFGGSVGFPVILAGRILGISAIIHEQTAAAGRANILSSYFAKKITLARKSSQKYFRGEKTELIGNPILPFFIKMKAKTRLGNPPVIYVTAGSRGSFFINSLVSQILKKFLSNFRVIHQAGSIEVAKFKKIKDNLPAALSENYTVFGQIHPEKLKEIYQQADILISRAGANSVAEIMAAKRPAVLIPIPWSYLDEQSKNAKLAVDFGVAKVLNQEGLTPEKLFREIMALRQNWQKVVSSVKDKKSPDIHAAKSLVDILEKEVRNSR